MARKYLIPQVDDETLIYLSIYTVRLHAELLRMLMKNYDKATEDGMSVVPASEFETFGPNWREDLIDLFNYGFPAMVGEDKEYFHWIDILLFEKKDDKENVCYQLSKPVVQTLDRMKLKFPEFFDELICFERAYSYKLFGYFYEDIKSFKEKKKKGRKVLTVSVSELMEFCSIPFDFYRNKTEFRRIILKKTLEEINMCMGMNMEVHSSSDNRSDMVEITLC